MNSFNWMSPPRDPAADYPLDVQSRGRVLTDAEQNFADALEKIFSDGCHDMNDVATRLNEYGVAAPSGAQISWTIDTLASELNAINTQLDNAFEEHGYGA